MNDLAFTPALEQAQLIRKKEVSPIELVELYLERIGRKDTQLGSYFTVAADLALADAKAKTEMLAKEDVANLPPFFGVPISIKDLTSVAGVRCTYGSRALMDQIAAYDEGIVSRIRGAGFIILGKTATSELGSLPYTEPEGFAPTRNPWNLDYTPGGSSGGAAASVAAGLCAIAQGSDGGGSIRCPASCCGLVGIKPSRGRVSYAPVGDRLGGLASHGPIARTVADAAALLDVMSGYIIGDPFWLPSPDPSFLTAATSQPPNKLRIGFATTIPPLGEAAPANQQAVLETAKLLEGMGHTLEPVSLDLSELIDPFKIVWQAAVAASGIPKPALGKMNQWLLEQTGDVGEYLRSLAQTQVTGRKIVAFFDNFDLLLLPVYMHPTIRIGEWENLSPEETLPRIINWIAPCPPFNASGQPAIAIPASIDSNGLPIGVQLVGRPAEEATIIAIAAQIETQKRWSDKRPDFAI